MLKRTTIAFSVLSLLWTVSMLAPEAFAHDCVAPEASFSVNPDTVCVGCPVDVNASASYDPDGPLETEKQAQENLLHIPMMRLANIQ